MRTFNRELDRMEPPNLDSMRRDFDPSTVPLFGDSILSTEQQSERFFLRKLLEQEALLERYSRYDRPKPPPDAESKTMITPEQLAALTAEQLSSLTTEQMADLDSTQLGETSDKPLKDAKTQTASPPPNESASPESTTKKETSTPKKMSNDEINSLHEIIKRYGTDESPPLWKKDHDPILWKKGTAAIKAISNGSQYLQNALQQYMAAEGDKRESDVVYGVRGISLDYTKETLSKGRPYAIKGIDKIHSLADVDINLAVQIWKHELDVNFRLLEGGVKYLDKFKDQKFITMIIEPYLRFGREGGDKMIRDALGRVDKASQGLTAGMGPEVMARIEAVFNDPKKRDEFDVAYELARLDQAYNSAKKQAKSKPKEEQKYIAETTRSAEKIRVNNIMQ